MQNGSTRPRRCRAERITLRLPPPSLRVQVKGELLGQATRSCRGKKGKPLGFKLQICAFDKQQRVRRHHGVSSIITLHTFQRSARKRPTPPTPFPRQSNSTTRFFFRLSSIICKNPRRRTWSMTCLETRAVMDRTSLKSQGGYISSDPGWSRRNSAETRRHFP